MMQKDNNNYQWFTYGRSPLDSVREGDRAADYMDKYCTNETRMMPNTFLQKRGKDKTSSYAATNKGIKYWPNPADEVLHIMSDEKIASIQLLDNKMQLIEDIVYNQKQIVINIDSLNKGIYYMEVRYEDNSTQLINFIKQ